MSEVLALSGQRRPAHGRWTDRVFVVAVRVSAGLLSGVFVWILVDLSVGGLQQLSWEFLTTAPEQAGRGGGIAPILVSTVLIVGIAIALVVPVGLGTAVFLSEWRAGSRRRRVIIRRSLDVLAGVPSIVFGLFGNAFFVVGLGLGYSLLSGALTLACMVLPLFVRASEEALRAVPDEWRHGAAACGMSRTGTLLHVLLPAAAPGLMVALVLALGRALAETAALLFTSGYASRMPGSLFDSGRSLSVHIYDLAMNVAGGTAMAHASALVLLIALLAINGMAWTVAARYFARTRRTR